MDELRRYHRFLFSHIQPFLKGRVCEIGSGTGGITQFLMDYSQVTAVEPDGPCHLIALQKFAYQLNVRCVKCSLDDCPNSEVPRGSFDTVIGLNLLEHLEDDVIALEQMGDLTSEGGHLVVMVPAGRWLYGPLDRTRGHYRRYSRRDLEDAFAEAELMVMRHFYFNVPGALAWWLAGRVLRRRQISPKWARCFDRLIPLIEATERTITPLFGHSLVMIGRRM